jgi:integrase
MDGHAAAATTTRRRRSVFYNVLQYAVELELLDYNPVDKLRVRATRRKVVTEVDRPVVVNPRQARELLVAVTYIGRRGTDSRRGERLLAFFACLYYAALRPGEALGLCKANCKLPDSGWGLITVESSRPTAGRAHQPLRLRRGRPLVPQRPGQRRRLVHLLTHLEEARALALSPDRVASPLAAVPTTYVTLVCRSG